MIEIFTDGASTGNPGPGGWAAIIRAGGRTLELSGGFRLTTNNRMELFAAIAALEVVDTSHAAPAQVRLYSDSRYLVEAITRGWAEQWRAKGWRQTKNRPTPNADLWSRLLLVMARHDVSWEWVRGHAGHPENERADRLATQAAGQRILPADAGYESAPNGAGGGDGNPSAQPGLFESGAGGQKDAEVDELPAGSVTAVAGRGKVTRAGQPCRKCGTAVVKQTPTRKVKPGQAHYYAWYLICPNCKTIYLVDEAKREMG